MATNVIYGIGGWCMNCDETHEHPFENILSIEEIPETPNPLETE